MEPALDREDVTRIIEGLFHIHARLVDIDKHLAMIRVLLGEGQDGEEEEEADPGAG